jgi:hypothetical protein
MPKRQEPMELCAAGGIPFEHRDFNTAQLREIFSCGKTTLFTDILPHLEVYYEGTRLKATGRSILELRKYAARKKSMGAPG